MLVPSFEASETSPTRSHLKGLQGSRTMHRIRCDGRLWKVKSKGAVLTLLLHFLVSTSFFALAWLVLSEGSYRGGETQRILYSGVGLNFAILAATYPLVGFLSDAYYSRFTMLRFGLWCMWLGMLWIIVAVLLSYTLEGCQSCRYLFYAGGLVGSLLLCIGIAAYVVNAISFGIDQMPDASAEELSAYIHWFVLVMLAGGLTGRLVHLIEYCVPVASNIYIAGGLQLMVSMVSLSVALCCLFFLHGYLIIEPESPNSLRRVYRVLTFAATHKHPVRRRAITYTEDVKPSRIDFAKDKYGGPFTTEQVEDVKTFFRIIVVIAFMNAVIIPIVLTVITVDYLWKFSSQGTCTVNSYRVTYSVSLLATVCIPVYTVVIYPLTKRRVLSTLQRMLVTSTLVVLLTGTLFVINTIKHALDSDLICMFSTDIDSSSHNIARLETWLIVLCNAFLAVCLVMGSVSLFEFICAQSPYHMRGLLFGIMYFCIVFTPTGTFGVFVAWKTFHQQVSPSCDFYYLMFLFLCAVVGLILMCIVARWYKRRQREEEDNQRRIVEEIYDRVLRNHS